MYRKRRVTGVTGVAFLFKMLILLDKIGVTLARAPCGSRCNNYKRCNVFSLRAESDMVRSRSHGTVRLNKRTAKYRCFLLTLHT